MEKEKLAMEPEPDDAIEPDQLPELPEPGEDDDVPEGFANDPVEEEG